MANLKLVEEQTGAVKARTVLWYMTFFGFAVNYIIRINASIAIVDMIDVNYKKASNQTVVVSECIIAEHINDNFTSADTNLFSPAENVTKYISFERRILDFFNVR